MIVSRSFIKYKKLEDKPEIRPNTFIKIKGKNGGIIGILPDNKLNNKEIVIDKEDTFGTNMELDSVHSFQLLPNIRGLKNTNIRDILFITGKSGSGKTYYVGEYAKEYRKMFPKRKIIYISPQKLETDDLLNQLNPFLANCSGEEAISNWVDPETKFCIPEDDNGKQVKSEFDKSLIIIDDLEGINNKNVKKGLDSFISSILHTGRHRSISVCFLNHIACNNKDTKAILNETHYITIFTNSCKGEKIDYLLRTYCGLNKEQIKYVKNLRSRWVTIGLTHPSFVMTDKELLLL